MTNYLFYDEKFPYHFSIGAIVLDEQNKVLCHHFKKIFHFEDLYILMRETPETNETTEETLKRGLREEFGAKADIINYIGSIVSHHPEKDLPGDFEKTTLYFLCKLTDFQPETRTQNDPESGSEILFMEIDELLAKMQSQAERYTERTDLDESKILTVAKKYI